MIDMEFVLAVLVVFLGVGGLICGAVIFAAIWRDEPIFAPVEFEPGRLTFPPRPPATPPRRPFDRDRDRWEW